MTDYWKKSEKIQDHSGVGGMIYLKNVSIGSNDDIKNDPDKTKTASVSTGSYYLYDS